MIYNIRVSSLWAQTSHFFHTKCAHIGHFLEMGVWSGMERERAEMVSFWFHDVDEEEEHPSLVSSLSSPYQFSVQSPICSSSGSDGHHHWTRE